MKKNKKQKCSCNFSNTSELCEYCMDMWRNSLWIDREDCSTMQKIEYKDPKDLERDSKIDYLENKVSSLEYAIEDLKSIIEDIRNDIRDLNHE